VIAVREIDPPAQTVVASRLITEIFQPQHLAAISDVSNNDDNSNNNNNNITENMCI